MNISRGKDTKLKPMEIKVENNLILKQIELSDAKDIFATINSQRDYLGKWLTFVAHTHTIENTQNFINTLFKTPIDQREYTFVIRLNGHFAGIIGFRDTDKANKRTEIGYWLSENFQKKGIIIRSIKKIISFAFSEMDINRIQIKCALGNTPSKEIPEKLNFKIEGIERDGELLSDGKFTDLMVYSLLKTDY